MFTCSSETSTSMSPGSSSAPVIQRSGGWAVRVCCSNFSSVSHSSCLWLFCSSDRTSTRSNGSAPFFYNTNTNKRDKNSRDLICDLLHNLRKVAVIHVLTWSLIKFRKSWTCSWWRESKNCFRFDILPRVLTKRKDVDAKINSKLLARRSFVSLFINPQVTLLSGLLYKRY